MVHAFSMWPSASYHFFYLNEIIFVLSINVLFLISDNKSDNHLGMEALQNKLEC